MEFKISGDRNVSSCWLLLSLVAWLVLADFAGPVCANDDISKATTSRAARQDAIQSIPFRRLSPQAQQRISSVVSQPTMFRRMPINVIECDPEMHRFLIRHPEVVVSVWQLMGITKVTAERVAPYLLDCADGAGTQTSLELIYGDNDTHLIFCEGNYEGPLFRRTLHGRCLLLLKSGFVQSPDGRYRITNRLDVFVQIDHAGVELFTKTLHPLLGKSADVNFMESMNFLQRMSQAAESNGPGMQHMASDLTDCDEAVRKQFIRTIGNVNARQLRRYATASVAEGKTEPSDPTTASIRSTHRPAGPVIRGR